MKPKTVTAMRQVELPEGSALVFNTVKMPRRMLKRRLAVSGTLRNILLLKTGDRMRFVYQDEKGHTWEKQLRCEYDVRLL